MCPISSPHKLYTFSRNDKLGAVDGNIRMLYTDFTWDDFIFHRFFRFVIIHHSWYYMLPNFASIKEHETVSLKRWSLSVHIISIKYKKNIGFYCNRDIVLILKQVPVFQQLTPQHPWHRQPCLHVIQRFVWCTVVFFKTKGNLSCLVWLQLKQQGNSGNTPRLRVTKQIYTVVFPLFSKPWDYFFQSNITSSFDRYCHRLTAMAPEHDLRNSGNSEGTLPILGMPLTGLS